MTNRIDTVCEEITKLKIHGNIVGNLWYSKIKTEYKKSINGKTQIIQSKKPNLLAISILADLIYWHKLTEERDEAGNTISWKKKFKGDKLQKSYQSYADFFDVPKSTVKQAFDQLERMKLIKREFRNIKVGKDKLPINNVMFIEVIPKNIESLSHDIPKASPRQSKGYPKDSLNDEDKEVSGTNTNNTTNNTTDEYSKEYSSNSKEVALENENFDSKNSNSEQNNKPLDHSASPPDPKNKKAQSLRDGAKSIDSTKSDKCPLKYQKYLDEWEKYTGRKFRGINKSYIASWEAIRDAINGKFFNSNKTSSVDKSYYKETLDFDTWVFVLKRFALMRNNSDYHPKNKTTIKNLNIEKFLYNSYNQDPKIKMNSCFLTCLEYEPQRLAPVYKDPNPEITDYIIERVRDKFGWDLSNGGRPIAIKCQKQLNAFFDKHENKITNFDLYYTRFDQKLTELLDMLEHHEDQNFAIKPDYLCSNLTYTKFMPDQLKRIGVFEN